MDPAELFLQGVAGALPVLVLALVLAVAVLGVLARLPWFKGYVGELLIRLLARLRLDRETYAAFHNVTLQTLEGSTQIDHIFVSRYGVFVVETKNMKGRIHGRAGEPNWTQRVRRRSYVFQNPLRQNYKHLKTLQELLDLPEDALHSVVVFVGDARLMSPRPANVTHADGLIRYIASKRDILLSDAQVIEAAEAIAAGRLAPSRATDRARVEALKARLDDAQTAPSTLARRNAPVTRDGRDF